MTIPCRWSQGGLPGFTGRVRFRRRFGYPGRIDVHERVWLTFAGIETLAEVTLNGTNLGQRAGAKGPFEFEITPLLQTRNEMIVDMEGAAETGGIWGEVALEVRCAAFLRELSVHWNSHESRLHVTGELVGHAERRLELYLLLDGANVGYATLETAGEARAFTLVSDELTPEQLQRAAGTSHQVRVDLVNGASLWYLFEQSVEFPTGQGRSEASASGARREGA